MKRILKNAFTVILQDDELIKDSKGYINQLNDNIIRKDVSSLEEASREVQEFISDRQLGSSTFTGGDVYKDGDIVARVSYNGKVWDLDGNQLI